MNAVHTSRSPVQLVPLTPELRVALDRAAAADGHRVLAPSHAVMKGGEILGGLSLGGVPTVFLWMDTQRAGPRDTYETWRAAANHLAGRGTVCVPCTAASPLRPFLARLAGNPVVTAELYLKGF